MSEEVTRKKWVTTTREIKPVDVMEFSRQLSSFLEAGIPIIEALETVEAQIGTPQMAKVVNEIKVDVQRGTSFTDAVGRHPNVFPDYYRAVLRSADYTGRVDRVLAQLTTYLERDIEARRQLRSAMTYPAVVLVVATIALGAMTFFVLPKFADLYKSLGATLPLPTRMLLGFTNFVTGYWWLILAVIILILAIGQLLYGGAKGKPRRDRMLLKLPVIGPLIEIVSVERFARVLAALSESGVPLPEAITVASEAANNTVYREAMETVREALVRGGGLSQPMEEVGVFPLPALQMVRVGERTGTLSVQLAKASAYYEREVTFKLKRTTELFQPLVIFGVGLVVGFIAVAQVSAMYSVFSQVK